MRAHIKHKVAPGAGVGQSPGKSFSVFDGFMSTSSKPKTIRRTTDTCKNNPRFSKEP